MGLQHERLSFIKLNREKKKSLSACNAVPKLSSSPSITLFQHFKSNLFNPDCLYRVYASLRTREQNDRSRHTGVKLLWCTSYYCCGIWLREGSKKANYERKMLCPEQKKVKRHQYRGEQEFVLIFPFNTQFCRSAAVEVFNTTNCQNSDSLPHRPDGWMDGWMDGGAVWVPVDRWGAVWLRVDRWWRTWRSCLCLCLFFPQINLPQSLIVVPLVHTLSSSNLSRVVSSMWDWIPYICSTNPQGFQWWVFIFFYVVVFFTSFRRPHYRWMTPRTSVTSTWYLYIL